MKEEILTAKEWLRKGFAPVKNLIADEDGLIQQEYFEECMEKYADYKTKMLEGKILHFRQLQKEEIVRNQAKYVDSSTPIEILNDRVMYTTMYCSLDDYDKHFGIMVKTEGKIS